MDKTKETYQHLYAIRFRLIGRFDVIVSADNMDKQTAKYIMQQKYPVLARIFPVKF